MTTTTFESWELPARLALGDLGVGYHTANPIIEDARAHCESTGQSPYEAFGEPRVFAARAAADVPVELREAVDREGMTPSDYLSGQLFALTLLVLVATPLFAAIDRTWTFPATTAGLTGLALLAATFFGAHGVPQAVRASGRPHLVKYCYLGVVVLILATATAFTTLPREHLFPIPVLAVVGVAAAALAWQGRAPKKPQGPAARAPEPEDADAWFKRLDGLLVGRYDLPPDRAAELTRGVRARSRSPREEFGPVEEYARQLQENEPVRKVPFWRTRPAHIVGILVGISLAVQAFLGWRADGVWWAAWFIALPGALGGLYFLVREIRRKR
ncbi:hypothetical protein JIG36_05390 [Actinoplanes sp. LDG1-06]|uniref:DUF2207 domain-containing protein n=1 Tax=Paractinoplanes ovalisporus TaxID=2810368 RepID=A0ABS2A6W6_9ACTN|nr:hypothetical protein [Actinoplanes ovalisporus]MBM2614991.1 hypothetical protein [Actinoplanes ovalisporus]